MENKKHTVTFENGYTIELPENQTANSWNMGMNMPCIQGTRVLNEYKRKFNVVDSKLIKVLFLDIDGVLNTTDYCSFLSMNRTSEVKEKGIKFNEQGCEWKTRDEFGLLFDPRAVGWLDYLIKRTGAKIVISSTWRKSGLQIMRNLWEKRNLPGEIIDITPDHYSHTFQNKYIGTEFEHHRGIEIEDYLIRHPEVEAYCIFDDDADMLSSQMENFVQLDGDYGITYEAVRIAMEILGTEEL